MLGRLVRNTVRTGTVLTATTTLATVLASLAETGKPWAATNCICHIVDGNEVEQPFAFDFRATSISLAINTTAMFVWSFLYEAAMEVGKVEPEPLSAVALTTSAWLVDYRLVPKRFTPGIEKELGHGSILGIYAVLAATVALSGLWTERPAQTGSDHKDDNS